MKNSIRFFFSIALMILGSNANAEYETLLSADGNVTIYEASFDNNAVAYAVDVKNGTELSAFAVSFRSHGDDTTDILDDNIGEDWRGVIVSSNAWDDESIAFSFGERVLGSFGTFESFFGDDDDSAVVFYTDAENGALLGEEDDNDFDDDLDELLNALANISSYDYLEGESDEVIELTDDFGGNLPLFTRTGPEFSSFFGLGGGGTVVSSTAGVGGAIPEPSSLLMMGVGSLGFVLIRRRKKQTS